MAQPTTPTNIKVNNLLDNTGVNKTFKTTITWDASPETDIVSYKIYRSFVPYGVFTLITTVSSPTLTYTDTLSLNSTIYVPGSGEAIVQSLEGIWYYCVSAVNSTSEESDKSAPVSYEETEVYDTNPFSTDYTVGPNTFTFAPEDYTDLPDNEDLKEYFLRLRYQNIWLLMDHGQDVWLYKRKKEGTKCPHWDDDAQSCPHPLGKVNNVYTDACYGTGILGGYYAPVKIKLRYVSALSKLLIDREGMRVNNVPRSWTIWSPRVSNFDFFVTSDGARYEITGVNRYTARGGLITHQDFDTIRKWETDLIYYVPTPDALR